MALLTGALFLFKIRKFGSFAFKNWKLVLIVGLVAAIGLYHWDRSRTIKNLQKDIIVLEQNIASCRGAIDKQNSIIDKVASSSKKLLEEERARAAAEIEKQKQKTKTAIDKLRNKEVAQTCETAIEDLIDEAQGGLRWED